MSLKGIAAAPDLSVATVSRALNGYDDVAESTRKRLQDEAYRRGYLHELKYSGPVILSPGFCTAET